MKLSECKNTQFGFAWGNAVVVRLSEINKNRVFQVRTPRRTLTVRITETGLIRTYEKKVEASD